MRKTLLVAAVLALAGCGEKKAAEAPAAEAPAAEAPAMDQMSHDSGAMMGSDSMMTRDSAK